MDIIDLKAEPKVACNFCCYMWRLITNPEKDKVARKVIAFECVDCGDRVKTNITMER